MLTLKVESLMNSLCYMLKIEADTSQQLRKIYVYDNMELLQFNYILSGQSS